MSRATKLAIAKFGGGALALVGAFALIKLAKAAVAGPVETPLAEFVLAAGFIVLGAGWIRSALTEYHGGAYSVVGAVFVFAGAFNLARIIDLAKTGSVPDLAYQLAALALVSVGGALLLRAGHNRHIRFLNRDGAT